MSELNRERIVINETSAQPTGDGQARTYVKLALQERSLEDERLCSNNEDEIEKTVALLTIDLVNRLLPRPLELRLDYVKQVSPRPESPAVMLSLVRMREAGKESFLNGSCSVAESLPQAAARSVRNHENLYGVMSKLNL